MAQDGSGRFGTGGFGGVGGDVGMTFEASDPLAGVGVVACSLPAALGLVDGSF